MGWRCGQRLCYVGESSGNIGPFPFDAAQLLGVKIALDGMSTVGAVATLFETKHGLITGFDVAPGGRAVAIANDRGDHGFVGILPLAVDAELGGLVSVPNASIQWVAPSTDTDTAATWSQDGSRLAWRREATLIDSDGRDPRCTIGGYCGTAGPAYTIMSTAVMLPSTPTGRVSITDVQELHRDWITGYPDSSAGYGSRPMGWNPNGTAVVFGCETDGYIKVCAAHLGGTEAMVVRAPMS